MVNLKLTTLFGSQPLNTFRKIPHFFTKKWRYQTLIAFRTQKQPLDGEKKISEKSNTIETKPLNKNGENKFRLGYVSVFLPIHERKTETLESEDRNKKTRE